jgi:hypothetical protein
MKDKENNLGYMTFKCKDRDKSNRKQRAKA